jgi:hypothetical protein
MDKMVIPNRGRIVAVMVALALAGGLLTLALLALIHRSAWNRNSANFAFPAVPVRSTFGS